MKKYQYELANSPNVKQLWIAGRLCLGEFSSDMTLLCYSHLFATKWKGKFLWDWLLPLAQWIYQDRPLQDWRNRETKKADHLSPLPSCLFCGLICEEMFQYSRAFSHYLSISNFVNNVPLRTVFSWCASEFISPWVPVRLAHLKTIKHIYWAEE